MNMLKKIRIKTLFWTSILLKILDVGLTIYIINRWGITGESNPFVRYMINLIDVIPAMIGITLAYICFVWILYMKNRKDLLAVINVLMLLLVIMNSFATVIQ